MSINRQLCVLDKYIKLNIILSIDELHVYSD